MKKIIILFLTVIGFQIAHASTFYGGEQSNTTFIPQVNKQYIVLPTPLTKTKQVVEFFSFYCPHCYNFEMVYNIPEMVENALPPGAVFHQYTVNFFKMESKNLTRAWAYAIANGITSQVEKPLFNAVMNGKITSMKTIAQVFSANGIPLQSFNTGINSFIVDGLVAKQDNLNKYYNINATPTFIINGKYEVRIQGFENVLSYKQFAQEYTKTVLYLLNKY